MPRPDVGRALRFAAVLALMCLAVLASADDNAEAEDDGGGAGLAPPLDDLGGRPAECVTERDVRENPDCATVRRLDDDVARAVAELDGPDDSPVSTRRKPPRRRRGPKPAKREQNGTDATASNDALASSALHRQLVTTVMRVFVLRQEQQTRLSDNERALYERIRSAQPPVCIKRTCDAAVEWCEDMIDSLIDERQATCSFGAMQGQLVGAKRGAQNGKADTNNDTTTEAAALSRGESNEANQTSSASADPASCSYDRLLKPPAVSCPPLKDISVQCKNAVDCVDEAKRVLSLHNARTRCLVDAYGAMDGCLRLSSFLCPEEYTLATKQFPMYAVAAL